MEIQAMRLIITEQDLNDLAAKHLLSDQPIEALVLKITPEGIVISGEYPLFVPVKFESLWELGVLPDGRLTVRLARLKALGMPATALKGLVLNLLEKAIRQDGWLEIEDDTIRFDLDRFLAKEGLQAKTRLRSLECSAGTLTLAAGS
jgi:hypothetical protein